MKIAIEDLHTAKILALLIDAAPTMPALELMQSIEGFLKGYFDRSDYYLTI